METFRNILPILLIAAVFPVAIFFRKAINKEPFWVELTVICAIALGYTGWCLAIGNTKTLIIPLLLMAGLYGRYLERNRLAGPNS